MNKRERVTAAFQGKEVDHVPVCFWRHFSPDTERGEDIVDVHLKFLRETDEDFLKLQSDGFFGYPVKTLKELEKPEDLFHIEAISENDPFIRGQIERAKAITKRVDGEVITMYTLFCPLSVFRLQVGWDMMMKCMRENPEATMHAVDVIADVENKLIEGLVKEGGVDGIFLSVQNAELTRFTPMEYEKWVKPGDLKVLDYIDSIADYNVLHCCGWDADEAGTRNHVGVWKGYPLPVVNWASYVDKLDASQIREIFPEKTAWGGFDNRMSANALIYTGTEKEVKEETLRLIEKYGKERFMLGPDCSIQCEIDPRRLKWVAEASRSV